MNLKKTSTLISSALVGLLATTSLASASGVAAYATGNVNVRTGPSTHYTRVDTLYRGENVTVRQCQNGWCYVDHSGPDGWVSARYLGQRTTSNPRTTNPRVNFSLNFGSGGSSFSISVGSGSGTGYTPPPPPVTPKVCFYKGAHFTGSSFCVAPGTSDHALGFSWNDKISSIKVLGGAHVQVCKNWNYSGQCTVYNSNKSSLNAGHFNNRISSYQTWI